VSAVGGALYLGSVDHLTALRRELDAFGAALDGDLSAPVEHCGDWTLFDLAAHMGAGNAWVVTAVEEGHGNGYDAGAAPRDQAALKDWYAESANTLMRALAADPSTDAWSFCPPHTVGFWRRRRSQETLMHRWDAEYALGSATPMDMALAADGVAEVFDTMAPLMIARGITAEPGRAVRITATDSGGSWVYGPGEPTAEISGMAEDLLLVLWGRKPLDTDSLTWTGDHEAGMRVLAGPLVP
jgi:uncharacterized protein (TIGR03083 family)